MEKLSWYSWKPWKMWKFSPANLSPFTVYHCHPIIGSYISTIDSHVCFHRWLFADPVKPPRCTTGSVVPVNDFIKDVSGARLLPTTVLSYPVDWVSFCHLLKTQHCCLCPNERYNLLPASHLPPPPIPPPPTYPPPITCHPWYYSHCKNVVQTPPVLASYL